MSKFYSSQQIGVILEVLNRRFNCSIDPKEFHSVDYSSSSLHDILVQRISDEISGEWTTERAYAVLKGALKHMGLQESEISVETPLDNFIPRANRRGRVTEWSRVSGISLDVLKPNSILYGISVVLFFAFIPLGIGMDWFLSAIGMLLCAGSIFLLNKTASNFKFQTLGQLAEAVAWKQYLQQQKNKSNTNTEIIAQEVQRVLESA